MAMWDFTVDSEIQTELANNLKGKADAFDAQVKNMYGKIDSLGQHWVGEDYDSFKNGTEGYSGALQDLSDGIRMYANHFDKVAEGTETLSKELITIIENMTKEGNIGGSGGGFRPTKTTTDSGSQRKKVMKNTSGYTPTQL